MLRGRIRVPLALCCGALLCLAAPASAVAHGHTHAELLEHASDEHGQLPHDGQPSISENGHHDDHGHPAVDKVVSSRGVQAILAVPAGPVAPDFASEQRGVAAPAPDPFESPPDPHDRASANPRAPPVVSAF